MPRQSLSLQPKQLAIPFPLKGINQQWARLAQPDGTTASCANVWPTGRDGRARGAVRSGIRLLASTPANTPLAGPIQGMCQATTVAVVRGTETRAVKLCVVAGGHVYWGTPTSLADKTASHSDIAATGLVSICTDDVYFYIVDGSANVHTVLCSDGTVGHLTASKGSVPANATLCAIWRGRLVLAAGGIVYASRSGTTTDWLYADEDPSSAWASGGADASSDLGGKMWGLVIGLMPHTEDVLIVWTDHCMFRFTGDPSDGGDIHLMSDGLGLLGSRAATKDSSGNIWMATTEGLIRMGPECSSEECLKFVAEGRMREWFRAIDRTLNYVCCQWDRRYGGCWVTVVPKADTASTGMWYDGWTDGLFPLSFAATHGPMSTLQFDGDATADRRTIFGSIGGYLREVADAAKSDQSNAGASVAIAASLYLGPLTPYGVRRKAKMSLLEFIGGDLPSTHASGDWQVVLAVQTADEPYEALAGTGSNATITYTTNRRQMRWLRRHAGVVWFIKLSTSAADKYFSMEQLVLEFQPGGGV